MQDLDHDRPPTPPHQPTAGVRILRKEIEYITKCCFPDSGIVSLVQNPQGGSYNNRIYFLKLRHPMPDGTDEEAEQELVLKVNGRFFGPDKIQNEVSCFRLLQKHCPSIPAPKALAWSEDGHIATIRTPFVTGSYSFPIPAGLRKLSHGGWILMTRLPGNPLADLNPDSETMVELACQLGDIVSSWRQGIPAQKYCGNIRLLDNEHEAKEYFAIQGALHMGINTSNSITSIHEYYRMKLEKSLSQLETSATFARSRYLVRPIQAFIRDVLPDLDLNDSKNTDPEQYVFTHYDISPRNLLVSGQPLRIVGIVDFEFGGFFSAAEEFLNDFISNKGNFSGAFYKAYLTRLETNGVATPSAGFDSAIWSRSYWLEMLALRIAPWYLPGNYQGNELEIELKRAESEVEGILAKLGDVGSLESPPPYA